MSGRRSSSSSSSSQFQTTSAQSNRPDLDSALSISDQRTLYLVNIFILDTARFLNNFSATCEEKLADIHRRILRLNATLTLLEAELNGIASASELEELDSPAAAESSDLPKSISSSNEASSITTQHQSSDPSSSSLIIHQNRSSLPVWPEISEDQPISHHQHQLESDDPRLLKFLRMLRFGIPEQAVKTQMSLEGMDPDALSQFNRK